VLPETVLPPTVAGPTRTQPWTRTPRPSQTQSVSATPRPFITGIQASKTPAPPAQCPVLSSDPPPAPPFILDYLPSVVDWDTLVYPSMEEMLAYLNAYGVRPVLPALEAQLARKGDQWAYLYQDLTGDGISELMLYLESSFMYHPMLIVGCQGGQYVVLYEQADFDGYLSSYVWFEIQDLNRDGLLDIPVWTGAASQGGHSYDILTWDGARFSSMLKQDEQTSSDFFVHATGYITLEDRDADFVKEILIITGIPVWSIYYDGLPWRSQTILYKWDGAVYRHQRLDPDPPEYRFQAVQDGDYYTALGEYPHAQELYQQAIFDPDLEWWSPTRRTYLQEAWLAGGSPTMPEPSIDPAEYANLAAYARFRLLLLHLLRGWEDEAAVVYTELQTRYPAGQPGEGFAQAAAIFWQNYQSDSSIGPACTQVQDYIRQHTDLLFYLGSDHHGWGAPIYDIWSVCPFK